MILYITGTTLCLLIGLFFMLDDWAYRRPWVLFVAGVVAAAFGSMLKGMPILMKGLHSSPWSPEELDLAALAVDPLLGGLAGGLVASAVIIKLQILHAKSQMAAREMDRFTDKILDQARQNFQSLKDMKDTMPLDEYESRHAQEMNLLMHAIDRKLKAKERLSEVLVPGLGSVEQVHSELLDSEECVSDKLPSDKPH